MDGITAYAMTPELDGLLTGALVDRISMSDRHTLTLSLFTPRRYRYNLTLSANPSRPGLELSRQGSAQAMNPPPSFTMYLRKHLRRARLLTVSSPPYERLFSFGFIALDELGDEHELELIFECMPRTANLILLNKDRVIMGALRHIDHRVNRVREILPAHPYVFPPRPSALTPDLAALGLPDSWRAALPDKIPLSRALAQTIMGFSPTLGNAAVFAAGLDSRLPATALSEGGFLRLAASVEDLCRNITRGAYAPAVYYDRARGSFGHMPLAVHALPLPHLSGARPFEHIYEAVTDFNRARARARQIEGQQASLEKRLSDRIRHVQKKREHHESDLAEGQKAGQDQLAGELILAYLHSIPPGADEVFLSNYYEEGKQVRVSLDPRLSPADNAGRYFNRAKRKRRQHEAAKEFLDRDLDELTWLESLAVAARLAESSDDLSALDYEFLTGTEQKGRKDHAEGAPSHQPGKPASRKGRQKQTFDHYKKKGNERKTRQEPALSPRRFTSSDGFTILAGRNNLQNDHLVRKAARDDLWFHIRNQAGTHVILASGGREVPDRTLEEAAGIAAWYSGGGTSGSAREIDYCLVRDVRKIPGGRPGRVSYQNFKTIYSPPLDPSSLEDSSS